MWIRSYTKTYKGIKKEQIWKLWVDVDQWHLWNPGIEFATLEGAFNAGNFFTLKPQKKPKVRLQLTKVVKNKCYIDCTKFPGAIMYGIHEMEDTKDGLKLVTTMTVSGFLSLLWVWLVAQKVVDKIPEQTNNLVNLAKKSKK